MTPTSQNTAAVMVTFWPDDGLPRRLERISQQVGLVVVVDNTPLPNAAASQAAARVPNVDLIRNAENLGLAAGLNQGICYAMERGFQWILMLDQDTVANLDLLGGLREVRESYPDKSALGIVGANARAPSSGRLMEAVDAGEKPYVERKTVITSGSLLSARVFAKLGPFREDFFIEGVDLEYCLRMRGAGFKVVCSRKPLMVHAAGRMKEARFLWKRVPITHHAPWRYRFMARNLVFIFRKYFRQEPLWMLHALASVLKMMVKILLYENDRIEKLVAIFAGLMDGLNIGRRHNTVA